MYQEDDSDCKDILNGEYGNSDYEDLEWSEKQEKGRGRKRGSRTGKRKHRLKKKEVELNVLVMKY